MVQVSPGSLLARTRSLAGGKFVRYSVVSAICVVVAQVILFLAQFLWSAAVSNVVAVCLSAVPGYMLNRAWVWGKTGRSHVMKEIVPFWAMALLGLVISTLMAAYAEANAASVTESAVGQKLLVNLAALAAFGSLWVGKFIILNKVLFAHRRPAPAPEALS